MSAVEVLAEARRAGIEVHIAPDGKLKARVLPGQAPPDLLAALRAHKSEIVEILTGWRCKHCGELMGWPAAAGFVFGDGTAAHHACTKQSELGLIQRRAANVCSPDATADPAEIGIRSELP